MTIATINEVLILFGMLMKLFISISTLAYPYPNVVRIYLDGGRGGELGEMRFIICDYSYTIYCLINR